MFCLRFGFVQLREAIPFVILEPLFVCCTCYVLALEPALQGSYYSRSGTVLASGASFERSVTNGPGPFLAPGASFEKKKCYFRSGTVFWPREPGLKEECYQRSGTVFGLGSQL